MNYSNNNNTLYLIDASSYLHRAYHALPELMTADNLPTGAVYGVANMLRKLLKEDDPQHIAVIFDAKGKNFRHKIYAEYKANRAAMPDDLRVQLEPLYQLIELMGLPLIVEAGVEADDVIATLTKQAEQAGWQVIISTGDKDLAQLVSPQVSLVNTMYGTMLDQQGVKQKFGVAPEQMIDYLSLIGDKVDNIPGVNKVGPKTAAKWLDSYQSLDNLLAHTEEITGKVGENLRQAIAQLPISKQLITLKSDVKLPIELNQLIRTPHEKIDQQALSVLLSKLEFASWQKELNKLDKTSVNDSQVDYQMIDKLAQLDSLEQWIEQIKLNKIFAFEVQVTSTNINQANLIGISLAIHPGKAGYVAFHQLELKLILTKLQSIFNDSQIVKVSHNVKFGLEMLSKYQLELSGSIYDTMLESYLLNSVIRKHDLDNLALKYLGHKNISLEDICGKGSKQKSLAEIDVSIAGNYGCQNADIILRLHHELWPKINQHKNTAKIIQQIDFPLIKVLAKMEQRGVLLDSESLNQQSSQLAIRLNSLQQRAFVLAGQQFNLDSPKQLGEVLFERLSLPIIQKTPSGQPSTAEPVLQTLAEQFSLPKIILEYRSLAKLKSTYTDKLPKQVDPLTQRVHTCFQQAVTSTGRLSSIEPNLQNIPIRSWRGQQIREAFIVPQGYKMISCDYSQVELRIMAHLSQDPKLLQAFADNLDVHKLTASEIFGLKLDAVTSDHRRYAKAVNFGLIYGMSSFGLAKQLKISRADAQNYIDLYFARYPRVKQYMDEVRQQAAEQGYVETILGRRLFVPDISSSNMMRKKAAERAAINAPMQGSAADIIKLAMIKVDSLLTDSDYSANLLLQVHDELVLEVKADMVEPVSCLVKDAMETAVKLDVPLLVSTGVGDNWQQAH